MAYDREKIIRRLKALRAHAASAESFGSEAEAATFTEVVQRLLTEHKIEMAEVEEAEESAKETIDRVRPDYASQGIKVRRRRVDWMEDLARIVANAHYCRMLIIPGSSVQIFVGKKTDAETAAGVFVKLLATAESLGDKEYVKFFYECKEKGRVEDARGFKTSFLKGFCRRVGERYFEYLEALKAYYTHDTKALAVIRGSRDEVDDYVKNNVHKTATNIRSNQVSNREGLRRGVHTANEVDLTGHKKVSA